MKVGDAVIIIHGGWGLADYVGTVQTISYISGSYVRFFLEEGLTTWFAEIYQVVPATELNKALS
jgi:hypothetical protein